MAKLKKRMLKNTRKQGVMAEADNNAILKAKMQSLVEEEKYVDAMDVMAEIAQSGNMDADTMYLGAVCYYATGDYGRAAKWINNTLTSEPGHVQACVLLGRLCIAEDRCIDGLRVLENVLGAANRLTAAERDGLENDLYYYKYMSSEELADFPKVRAFLGIEAEPADSSALEAGNEGKNSAGAAIDSIIQQIMEKAVCQQEKIKLLNAFAAGCYQKQDYAAARRLLTIALDIDAFDRILLQNMVYVCVADGDVDMAMDFASRVPMIDFGCLAAVKG